MSGNIFDTVQSPFAASDLESVQCLYTELEKKIDVSRTSSVDELLSAINSTSRSLTLEILVQRATSRNMFEIRRTKLALL